MAHKRAILQVLADIHVLPIPPTTRVQPGRDTHPVESRHLTPRSRTSFQNGELGSGDGQGMAVRPHSQRTMESMLRLV
jgi:hypothetical protein